MFGAPPHYPPEPGHQYFMQQTPQYGVFHQHPFMPQPYFGAPNYSFPFGTVPFHHSSPFMQAPVQPYRQPFSHQPIPFQQPLGFPSGGATVEPPMKKSRHEDFFGFNMNDVDPTLFASAMEDAATTASMKILRLTPTLSVPAVVPDDWHVYYPHIWVARIFEGNENRRTVYESWDKGVDTVIRGWKNRPLQLGETFMKRSRKTFLAWLLSLKEAPRTNDEWFVGFHILYAILAQLYLIDHTSDEVVRLEKILDTLGSHIDLPKVVTAAKLVPRK